MGASFLFGVSRAVPQNSAPLSLPAPKIELDRTESGRFKLRVDVDLTVVPVTVTDARDEPVTGLQAEAFRLFEDNVEQKIVHFSQEEGPVSVAIIFDSSGSMKDKLDPSVSAVNLLFKTAITDDEFALIRFDDDPYLLADFTDGPEEIAKRLSNIQPKGWTSLRDAIHLGVQELESAKNSSRILLVLSDGADNSSRHSESETRTLVQESDVRLYAIGLFQRPRFLEKLAQDTGGEAVVVHGLEDLPRTIARISRRIRQRYLLAYSSTNPQHDGTYRKLRVQVQPPPQEESLVVRARTGYYTRQE